MDSAQSWIDLMLEQPAGWLLSSLPILTFVTYEILQLMQTARGGISFGEACTIVQRKHWLALTGVEPADAHFTIIVPVHNEQHYLPSFLGTLLASHLPSAADVQVIFVVNASTDQSKQILFRRLEQWRSPTQIELPPSIHDSRRSNLVHQFGQDGLRFSIVETPTAGKANALNIGNEMARQRGHPLAVNIDANNWVEPDSIAQIYASARHDMIDQPESGIVLINSQEFSPKKNETTRVSARPKTLKAEVTGWMFAWSTDWIAGINGFPRVAIEDYGVGLLALAQGRKIIESEARIWGYAASTSTDENKEMVRYIYGAMQLGREFGHDPLASQILLQDFPHLRPLADRLSYFLFRKQDRGRPLKYVKGVGRWLKNEWLIVRARQEMQYAPNGQTWETISSTK